MSKFYLIFLIIFPFSIVQANSQSLSNFIETLLNPEKLTTEGQCMLDSIDDKKLNIQHNEPIFTLTHKTDNDEKVHIFLQDKLSQVKKVNPDTRKYLLKPNECLEITKSQFDSLIVKVGIVIGFTEGSSRKLTTNKTICGHLENKKCQPNHYEIIDKGDFRDDYAMTITNEPNSSEDCMNIALWMEYKNIENL